MSSTEPARPEPRGPTTSAAAGEQPYIAWVAVILVAGLLLQLFLWARQSLLADQLTLLATGLELIETGRPPPVAKGMSGGGMIPGALLSILTGAPLALWPDYRAPGLLIVLFHLAAAAIIVRTVGRAMGLRFLAIFLALYWLSPWHTSHSGFLWEPNYLILPAALHLGLAYRMRAEKKVVASAALAATIVLTMQIHASFVILIIASAHLAWRKLLRIDWRGAVAGIVVGSLTLIPTVTALARGELPRLVPQRGDELDAPLMALANALKAALYWIRLGSPEVGRRLRDTLYLADGRLGESPVVALPAALAVALVVLATAAILASGYASWRYLRPSSFTRPFAASAGDEAWIRAYAQSFAVAVLLGSAISPVVVQGWHVVIALAAACIPVSFLVLRCLDSGRAGLRALAFSYLTVQIAVSLLVAFGHPMFLRRVDPRPGDPSFPSAVRPLISPGGD